MAGAAVVEFMDREFVPARTASTARCSALRPGVVSPRLARFRLWFLDASGAHSYTVRAHFRCFSAWLLQLRRRRSRCRAAQVA